MTLEGKAMQLGTNVQHGLGISAALRDGVRQDSLTLFEHFLQHNVLRSRPADMLTSPMRLDGLSMVAQMICCNRPMSGISGVCHG